MTVGNFLQHDVLFLLQLSFPVLQNLGTLRKKPIGHWYMLSVNFAAKMKTQIDAHHSLLNATPLPRTEMVWDLDSTDGVPGRKSAIEPVLVCMANSR